MNAVDTTILRNAIDIAIAGRYHTTLSDIAGVLKLLAPDRPDLRVEVEEVQRAGFPVASLPSGQLRVEPDQSGRAPFLPDREESFRIAYRHALAGTKDAPFAGWADFNRFSQAVQALQRATGPEARVRHPGKKLRAAILSHPLWRFEEHTPIRRVVSWSRDKRDAYGNLVTRSTDSGEISICEACGPDDEGAAAYQATERGPTRQFIRPTGTEEWPRLMEVTLPSGARRRLGPTGSLHGAVWTIEGFATAVVEHGTRVRVWRQPDEAEDFVAVYHAEADTWRREDGQPLPQARHGLENSQMLS